MASVDSKVHWHRPIIVTDLRIPLGSVIGRMKVKPEHPEDDVVDDDLILVWGEQKRIITGAVPLGAAFTWHRDARRKTKIRPAHSFDSSISQLGRGLVSAQPQPDQCKLKEGEVVCRKPVITGNESPTTLDLVEEPLGVEIFIRWIIGARTFLKLYKIASKRPIRACVMQHSFAAWQSRISKFRSRLSRADRFLSTNLS